MIGNQNKKSFFITFLVCAVAILFSTCALNAHAETFTNSEERWWFTADDNILNEDGGDSVVGFSDDDGLVIGNSNVNDDLVIGESEALTIGNSEEKTPENLTIGSSSMTIGESTINDINSENMLKELKSIHTNLDIILYFIIPFSFAVLLIYKFCLWFYETFIKTVM